MAGLYSDLLNSINSSLLPINDSPGPEDQVVAITFRLLTDLIEENTLGTDLAGFADHLVLHFIKYDLIGLVLVIHIPDYLERPVDICFRKKQINIPPGREGTFGAQVLNVGRAMGQTQEGDGQEKKMSDAIHYAAILDSK